MDGHITCQGRVIGQSELCWLRDVVCEHPDWSRHKITKHICRHWDWRTNTGQLKTFAARSMIDKLEQRGVEITRFYPFRDKNCSTISFWPLVAARLTADLLSPR